MSPLRSAWSVVVVVAIAACDVLAPPPPILGGRPSEGEGEEGEGEGDEGEGEGNEGEGEGPVGEGEGEGPVGEGEGEGPVGEGEGEGEVPSGLVAQVSWSATGADLDVRGVRQGLDGRFCVDGGFFDLGAAPVGSLAEVCTPALDCSFSNCRATTAARPDWDGSGGTSAGDPIIDVDDTSGPGLENLSVADVDDGSYLFGIFAFRADAPTASTFRVFDDGLQLERTATLDDNEWLEVAVVQVRGGVVCVEDLTDAVTTQCP